MVQVTVTGDSNSSVILYYPKTGYGTQTSFIGTTNSGGYLTTTISTSSLGITAGSSVHVVVNNQTSYAVVWPYATGLNTIYFSPTNPTVNVGQSTTVYVSGGQGSYYVSTNSNSNIVQTSLSGSTLTLSGIMNGTSVITVCSSVNACGSLTVTVGYSGGNLSLSQTNISLTTGQSASVSIYGTGNYYFSGNINPSVATVSISGSSLVIYGVNYGSTSFSVCQTGGQCVTAYVTVTNNIVTPRTSFLTFSPANPTLPLGQSTTVSISGDYPIYILNNNYPYNYGVYTIAYNSNSSAVQAYISGNSLVLTGSQQGAAVIVVCSSSSVCGPISVKVGVYNIYDDYSGYQFTRFLTLGSTGDDVIALQELLTQEGYYSGNISGRYGSLTRAAVLAYQTANGLPQTGNVGVSTRDFLNNNGGVGYGE